VSATAKTIPLLIGEDLDTVPQVKTREMTLELQIQPAESNVGLVVQLNEQRLVNGRASADWVDFDVEPPPYVRDTTG